MLALTLSLLAQVEPRPVWVPGLTFPEPAYAISVWSQESVAIRSGTYEVKADKFEREQHDLHPDIKRHYSVTSGQASQLGTFGVPIAKNGIVYANEYCAFVIVLEEGRLWRFVLLPYPYKFQAPLPIESDAALKRVESAFRESRARLVGDQVTSPTLMTINGFRIRTASVKSTQTRFVHADDLTLLGLKSVTKELPWLLELSRNGKSVEVAWGTPYLRMGEQWELTTEGVALRGDETWIPLAAVERLLDQ